MPRQSRILGDYAHLIVRGNGRQILFEDDSDYNYFLLSLRRYRDETGISLIAYCLMENHVHLLVNDSAGATPLFMKKLCISYARYYNHKYSRTGHLFQDRYKSENVQDDAYFLTVYRYILKNPEKAGIARAETYPWSSFAEYGKSGCLTDTSLPVALIGGAENFALFFSAEDKSDCMEDAPIVHDDAWARRIIRETLDGQSGTVLQKLPKQQRNELLFLLKQKGLSIRQLERLTGISRGVVQKAGKGVNENRPR